MGIGKVSIQILHTLELSDQVQSGYAFKDLKGVNLYPSVGMKRPLAHLSVNFGQKPFTFDIDGMMAVCTSTEIPSPPLISGKNEKADIGKEINSVDVSKLFPPLDENSLLKELVAQFLAHDGYVETRKAFAEEVLTEEDTLKSGRLTALDNYALEEDTDAVNRQRKTHSYFNMRGPTCVTDNFFRNTYCDIGRRY